MNVRGDWQLGSLLLTFLYIILGMVGSSNHFTGDLEQLQYQTLPLQNNISNLTAGGDVKKRLDYMKSISRRTLTGGWNVVTAKNLVEVESLLVRKGGFYLNTSNDHNPKDGSVWRTYVGWLRRWQETQN